ncbi:MAG: 5-formyltetrahydrofolate cyclo-ligase [Deltaproteobacteria bacterium]|nr:5-formyltetrahydrofolate cyclo-ligase [Deltaproteobacteria bacterium]
MSEADAAREERKAELRRRMRSMRKSLPPDAVAASASAAADLLDPLPFVAAARRVGLYAPVRAEIPTTVVDRRLRARGVELYYPRVDAREARLIFHRVDDPGAMRPGQFEVPEPDPLAPFADLGEIDVVLVPGMAFDASGARLGYGLGMYDRVLQVRGPGVLVGFCYDFQLVTEVPAASEDRPVAWVVTDHRVVEASSIPAQVAGVSRARGGD